MAWNVEVSEEADRQLGKLDPQTARRIVKFLYERVARLEDPRGIGEALRGPKFGELWKYRVGDYRVLARIEDNILRILVVKVGHRREVYER